ncbi:sodium-dependent glucose transporter 1-like protein [Dinothrombium tinctorium]|uniref:Sodium-dependent glucose transporter 1-like protein n=1 Tax=Dinothrombium tinctorium TaxID=1965070 RepID=A0A3S3PIF1_9ACAR|nr:sodium-dependent glucose transporter 1-like protein [Dinothrombium tinctorium]
MIAALPGATLLDLQIAVSAATVEKISYIIPLKAGGYALGSFLSKISVYKLKMKNVIQLHSIFTDAMIVNYLDNQIILLIALTISTAIIAVVPWNRTLIGICVTMFFIGIPAGVIDSVNSTTYKMVEKYTAEDLKIPYTYGIVSLFAFCVLIFFLIVYLIKRDNKPHPSRMEKQEDKQTNALVPGWTNVCIILFTCLFMLIYCGLELVFGTLLPTFAVKCDLKFDKSRAAFIASVYWGTYTFFRCFTIFAIDIIGSENLILFDLILVTVANVFLVPFGNRIEWCLWTGVAIMGLGTSSIFGAVFGFLEEFITLSGRVASLIFVNVCVGEFIVPFIVGKYADTKPIVFLYISLLCNILCCVSFAILMGLKRYVLCLKKRPQETQMTTIKF